MIIIRCTLTQNDLFSFTYYTEWSAPDKSSHRINYYLSWLLVPFAFAFILIISKSRQIELRELFIIAGIAFAMWLFLVFYSVETYRKRIRKLYSEKANSDLLLPKEIMIDNSGITERNENSECRLWWTAFIKKVETNEYFYLYSNGMQGIIIPKRYLTQEEITEIKLLLSRHLSLGAEFDLKQ